MPNRITLQVFLLAILLVIAGLILRYFEIGLRFIDGIDLYGNIVMRCSGIYLLYDTRSVTHAKFWYAIAIAIVVLVLGMLIKIMHWPGANQMIMIGSGSVIILYGIRFFQKSEKNHLDVLKLLFVWVSFGCFLLLAFHIHTEIPIIASPILLVLCVFDYMYIQYQNDTLFFKKLLMLAA